MKFSLADKSILIIDDYAVMRRAIRDMLQTYGASKFFEAENAANALNALRNRKFDIVFCDHNLGTGKNGQQILEEVRHRKLLSDNGLFFMISAESNVKKLMGVVDYKPDDYLSKPLTAKQLHTRLELHYNRKELLAKVESEVKHGQLSKAIQQLDEIIAGQQNKVQTFLLKRRAELAISAGDFATANKIYQEVLLHRELPWAKLGLGIIAFQQEDIIHAIEIFERLVAEQPMFMDAYDWLCKAYELTNNLNQLQNTLLNAVELSPQSIIRQKELAIVAERNGDLALAEKSFKAVLNLGKHSVFKSCSDFLGLAKVHAKNNAPTEAMTALQNMRSQFEGNSESELSAATLEAEMHQKQGLPDLAMLATQKMLRLNDQLGNRVSKELRLDIVKSCYLNQESVKADEMLNNIIETQIEDESFLNEVRRVLNDVSKTEHAESVIKATKRKLVAINNQGVALFQQGKFQEAAELFERARKHLPNNKTILVNMLKILIQDIKAGNFSEEKLLKCKTLAKEAERIGVDNKKLDALKMQIAAIPSQTISI